jgi:hypothetical protein
VAQSRRRHADRPRNPESCVFGGEAGIRTLDTGFSPYNGLANRRLQPLGHLTAKSKFTLHRHLRENDPVQPREAIRAQTAAFDGNCLYQAGLSCSHHR